VPAPSEGLAETSRSSRRNGQDSTPVFFCPSIFNDFRGLTAPVQWQAPCSGPTRRLVFVNLHGSSVRIVLEDQGEPPDPGRLRGRSLEEIKPGGLGLHYIRESIDGVEVSRSGGTNQLRLSDASGQKNTIQDS
jgi:hypothetical protein